MTTSSQRHHILHQLRNNINILVNFEPCHSNTDHHRVDTREPLNFYLGFSGVMASLHSALQVEDLFHDDDDNNNSESSSQQMISKMRHFMNPILLKMITYVNAQLMSTSTLNEFYKRDAHTLLFGQFNASCCILNDFTWNFPEQLQEKFITEENLEKLHQLFPTKTSFPKLLCDKIYTLEVIQAQPPKIFSSFNDVEPFYGRTGLVAAFLKSLENLSSNNNNNDEASLAKTILQSRVYPLIDVCLQSGVSQANQVREQLLANDHHNNNVKDQEDLNASIPPALWFWHGSAYVGGAHGTFGILYYCFEFLEACRRFNVSPTTPSSSNSASPSPSTNNSNDRFVSFLFNVLGQTESKARYASSSSTTAINYKPHLFSRSSEKLNQFCHGAVGAAWCFSGAVSVISSTGLLNQSQQNQNQQQQQHPFLRQDFWVEKLVAVAKSTMQKGGLLNESVGLCHGIPGCIFALLKIFKTLVNCCQNNTKFNIEDLNQEIWQKVFEFCNTSAEVAPKIHVYGDHIYSSYEGLSGSISAVSHVLRIWNRSTEDVDNTKSGSGTAPMKKSLLVNRLIELKGMPGYEV